MDSIKVLIIEDNPDDAELIKMNLSRAGLNADYSVVQSQNELQDILEKQEFDIILSDYVMPGFSGMDALKEIRQQELETPFILVSGTVGEDLAVDAVLAGANDYIMKDSLGRLNTAVKRELHAYKLKKEKKDTDKAYQKSRQRFEKLFENSIDGILIADKNRIISANPSACKILGYTKEELLGLPRNELTNFSDPDVEKALETLDQKKSFRGNLKIKCKDGSIKPVEISSQLYEVKGEGYQISTIFRDISDRLEAEEQIKKSLKEKEVLLAEIHHRVKNNMAIVSGLLTLQAGYQKDESVARLFDESINRIKSMALVHEMLYKSDSLASIELSHYVNELIQNFDDGSYRATKIDVNINVDKLYLDITRAIPCGLIINEVVTNAYKHAFKETTGGRIIINLNKIDKDSFRLVIQDNGIGFEDHKEIEDSDSLGFTIIKALVQQLHASMKITNDKGLRFEMICPALKHD